MFKKKYLSTEEALRKLQAYCAFQERCHEEVRTKLIHLNVFGDRLESIIAQLIEDDFLNELRFSKAYVGGKFRIKKWGKIKISLALKRKKISEYCIRKALESEINDEDYKKTLQGILQKKKPLINDKNDFIIRNKLIQHARQKGYEYPIIEQVLQQYIFRTY